MATSTKMIRNLDMQSFRILNVPTLLLHMTQQVEHMLIQKLVRHLPWHNNLPVMVQQVTLLLLKEQQITLVSFLLVVYFNTEVLLMLGQDNK